MKTVTRFVAVLFGPGNRSGEMSAPGDADCRWRAAAVLGHVAAVNDDCATQADEAATPAQGTGVGAKPPR